MLLWEYIFWVSCLIVFYNYIGYALIIHFINLFRHKQPLLNQTPESLPTISFVVAAYNEEDIIEKKIINSFEQNYPKEKVEFIFITDGSADKTPDIIRRYYSVRLLHHPDRRGKSAAVNRAVEICTNDILIFSDANTLLNADAMKNIARHYPAENVGGVAGEKKIISLPDANDDVGSSEGLYWKYESFLKKTDSDFYSVVGAAGELFSVRRNLFEPLSDNVILDDFIISLKVAQKGYRIIYEPEAYAMELPSFSIQDEQKRKVRIAAGGFQAIGMLSSLFLFWKHFKLSFLYISHRVLRWTLSPLCLLLALISNAVLCFKSSDYLFEIFFLMQLCFYVVAFFAKFVSSRKGFLKIFNIPYYFVFMNISVYQGFFRFLSGKQTALWEKAKRAQTNNIKK